MGACGSKPEGCVGMRGKLKLPKKRRRHLHHRTRRPKNSNHHHHHHNKSSRVEPSDQPDLSYTNPAFQGIVEAWFDPDALIDSDGDDEFYSVQDDVSQAGSISASVTPRFSNLVVCTNNTSGFDDEAKSPPFHDKSFAQCMEETAVKEHTGTTTLMHSCGFIANAFLPCIACDDDESSSDGRRRTPSLGGPSSKKRLSFTASFKFKEPQLNPILSAKAILQRPIAGSQIMCSPLEKKMPESWSSVDPSIFKVRGRNYNKDKKKESAANFAAYVPFGVDVFLSPRKIDHIARFVELPAVDSSGEVPTILVVNLQIPLYPATLFQSECDGPGMNFVFYFKLSEDYSEELPDHFRENIKRIIANEIEKIKGFAIDTNAPFRERLKILGRVVNVDDLQLSTAERKLMSAYNEKPVLSRPQHEFHLGENYLEIDLDIHRFSYIARKGFETFQDRIKNCVFDFGLTIQGNKAEDLPECMLCCARLKEIDYSNYGQLGL